LRAVNVDETIVVLGTTLSHSRRKEVNEMVKGKLNMDTVALDQLVHLTGPDPERREKNWIPFVYQGKLVAIYKLYPLVLVDVAVASRFVTVPVEPIVYSPLVTQTLSTLRGSSNIVQIKGGYLGIFHSYMHADGLGYLIHYIV
jgi:hypothetical protein